MKANTVARKNLNLHSYEVRPRDDRRGVDLISDALPFGRLWYGEPNAVSDAIGYAKFRSRSHDAVIPVYDESGQRDRDARARGRFQRGVVTVSLPCRLKILLTRFNKSLYRNAGRGQHLARTHPIRHSTARFGNGLRRVRCQRLATAMSQRPLVGETSPWLGNVQRRRQKVRHMVANLHSAQHSLFRRANRGSGFQ